MKKLLIALVIIGFGLYATTSSAQIFKLNVTSYGGVTDQTFIDFINSEIKKIEDEINKDLPSAPPQRLMEGMANSSVFAGKGIAGDYASDMTVFLIGAGVGAAADLAKDKNSDSDLSGVGVAPGAIIGFNLGFMDTARILGMDTNRLNLYLNFMSFKKDNYQISDDPGKESYADLDTTALGFRLRYNWITGKGTKLLGWGGVKFHFGYEYNKTNINFRSKINESVSENNGSETISGNIEGNPEAKIAVATHSIPLELSTDVQILYILSLYGGVGVDYNFGQAKGNGSLNADNSNITCTGGACGGGGATVQVKPEANIDATGKASAFTYRGFAGVQVNLPYIRIYGQVNKSLGSEVVGANAGVRFVF